MKKMTQLTLLCFLGMAGTSYGQDSDLTYPDFLRNYKAPNFKQKRFNILLNGDGSSYANYVPESINRFGQEGRVSYVQYSNSQRYQGNLTVGISNKLSNTNATGLSVFNLRTDFVTSSTNYFYLKPAFFIGLHQTINSGYRINRIDSDFDNDQIDVFGSAAVSAGFGRLEPIQYARNAMDIQRSLTKGGRVISPYSVEELTVLSDEIARINNVRFYDLRLRRIEQFEALDKTLQRLGHISDFDMTYFSYLADAYLYAQNFTRFSGVRHEFGLAETVNWTQYRYENPAFSNEVGSDVTSLFYRGSINIPASYTVQHDIEILSNVSYFNFSSSAGYPGEIGAFASSRYTLGFYPTTRTNYNVGVLAGISLVNDLGYSTGLFANGTFYLSPQFRLSCGITAQYGDNYYRNPFEGIWRDNGSSLDNFNISGSISLSYAIF